MNNERKREYSRRWYLANKEKTLARSRKWVLLNPEKARANARKWAEKHPEKRRAVSRAWRVKNPEKIRALGRAWRGLPTPTRATPQNCECCGRAPARKVLCLDYCHRTGIFRGWLCDLCNKALGMLDDNIEGLERAIAYLKRANKEAAQRAALLGENV